MFPIRDIYPNPIFLSALQSLVPHRETYAPMSFILAILFNILYLTLILEIKGTEDPGIDTIYMGKPEKYGWKITFRVITLGKFQKKMGGWLVSVRSLDYRPINLRCFCCYCCCYSTAKTTTGCSIHLFRSV